MSKFQIKLGRKPRPFRSKMAQELLSLALLYVVLDSNFFKRKNLVLHTEKMWFCHKTSENLSVTAHKNLVIIRCRTPYLLLYLILILIKSSEWLKYPHPLRLTCQVWFLTRSLSLHLSSLYVREQEPDHHRSLPPRCLRAARRRRTSSGLNATLTTN
jgi:L-lactate permease